jgi:glycosyltransferase involved in cell wall biosynthesis
MQQHARGEVPDHLPYGLDRLAGGGFEVSPREPPMQLQGKLGKLDRRLRYDWRHGLAKSSADILLTWDERIGVPASMRQNVPVVTGVIWGTEQPTSTLTAALRRAAKVWVSSSSQLKLLAALRVTGAEYVPMGVDSQFFRPQPYPQTRSVLSVGNDRSRDWDTIIRTYDRLSSSSNVLQLITRSAVPDRRSSVIQVTRPVSHSRLVDQYGSSAVVTVALKPNHHVSGVTVVLEAMSCARPVVVTNTPGMSDYVEDGVTGTLVPYGDDSSMAQAIADLLDDPERAQAYGAAGRAAVLKRFNTQAQADRLSQIMATL